jgi:hypothetical protein
MIIGEELHVAIEWLATFTVQEVKGSLLISMATYSQDSFLLG